MLLRYEENEGFWATPGGSLEPGESHERALARELHEELGIREAEIGPHLATRIKDHLAAGQPVRQAERCYLVRVPAEAVSPRQPGRPTTSRAGNGGPSGTEHDTADWQEIGDGRLPAAHPPTSTPSSASTLHS